MAKKFNLGDYLKTDAVSELNTEQIVLIDVDRIDPDPDNFYSLEGIDELAGNIELIGLQQPLRVRPAGERFVIVSGHRRRAAILLIRDGGSDQFAQGVPCIVEYGEASPAMRELRLIYANSSTRVMSSAEISKQAERVTELLYQLKEQGVDFPGRMREHVAQACQVSESKLARLHAIRNNLIPLFLEKYDSGLIGESVAYRLSQEPAELQQAVWAGVGISIHGCTAESVDMIIDQVKKRRETPQDSRAVEDAGPYRDKFDAEAYLAERAEEDDAFFEMLSAEADNFLQLMGAVNSRQDGIAGLKLTHGSSHHGWYKGKFDVTCSPKGVRLWDVNHKRCGEDITRTWTDVYDMLCTIALNRAAINIEAEPEDEDVFRMDTAEPEWMTGTPPRPGRYFCRVDMETIKPIENRCTWNGEFWEIYGAKLDDRWKVVGWWPLPEEA